MAFYLAGKITVPLADLERVRAALPEHVRQTRTEPGCRAFTVKEAAGGVFLVQEAFDDVAAFERHQARIKGTAWERASATATRDYKTWTA